MMNENLEINGVKMCIDSFPCIRDRISSSKSSEGEKVEKINNLNFQFAEAAYGDTEAVFNIAKKAFSEMSMDRIDMNCIQNEFNKAHNLPFETPIYTDDYFKNRDNALRLAEYLVKNKNYEKAKNFIAMEMIGATYTPIEGKTSEQCLFEADNIADELLASQDEDMHLFGEITKRAVKDRAKELGLISCIGDLSSDVGYDATPFKVVIN